MATVRVSKSLAPLRSPTPEVGLLFGGGTGAATSNMTGVVGVGITSIAHGALTGEYLVKLSDPYEKLLSFTGSVIDATTPDDWEVVVLSESVDGKATQSVANITLDASAVAAGETITVGGVAFTAAAAEDTAAGEFDVSGTDAAAATSLAACINASSLNRAAARVRAGASGAVVTVVFFISPDATPHLSSAGTYPNPDITTNAAAGVGISFTLLRGGSCSHLPVNLTAAGIDVDDTCTINGVVFTAKAAEDVSAAQFDQSGTDTACATSLAKCVNQSQETAIAGVLFATSSGGTVTLTAITPGEVNLAVSSSDAQIDVDGGGTTSKKLYGGSAAKEIAIMCFKGGAAADLTTDEKLRFCVALSNSARSY